MFDLIIKKGMAVLPDAVEMVDIAVKTVSSQPWHQRSTNGLHVKLTRSDSMCCRGWLMCTCIFQNPAALNGKAIVLVHRQWLPAELLHLQKCR